MKQIALGIELVIYGTALVIMSLNYYDINFIYVSLLTWILINIIILRYKEE